VDECGEENCIQVTIEGRRHTLFHFQSQNLKQC